MTAQSRHNRNPLPPYAKQWLDAGAKYGPQVICGTGAWQFAEQRKRCGFAIVAPPGQDPLQFDWTALSGRPVVLIEVGSFDTENVERTALALLIAGVPHVRTIRRVHPDQPLPICGSYARDEYADT